MLETERLILTPFCEDDLDIIYRLYSDREIMRYTPFDPMNEQSAAEHLNKIVMAWKTIPLIDRELLILKKDGNEKIGRCHIHIDEDTDSAMIGWLLVKPEWGKGYASECTRVLLDYSFDVLNVHRAYALCNPDNAASRRVLEKSGMRLEAHYREKCRYVKNGLAFWQDELEYAILKSERV